MKYFKKNYLVILGLIASLIAIGYILFQFQIQEVPRNELSGEDDYLDFFSKLGDAIGGFAGPLLSFASILFVLHTIRVQREELNEQRKELSNQRKEYIENKIFTIIYKEYDRWSKICENRDLKIEQILKPYLPTSNTFEPKIVEENWQKINKEENIELIEEYNKICFRLFSILFNDSELETEKLTSFFDRSEMRNILYTIGSLFETTKVYGNYDTILCYKPKDEKDLQLKAQKGILKDKMYFIAKLNLKIFEYQLNNLPEKEKDKRQIIYKTSNDRLFVFYQIDALGNKVKKIKEKSEEKPNTNKLNN